MNPSLNTLRVGESALVSHIEAEPAMRRRLLELGLVPGTPGDLRGGEPRRGSGGLPDPGGR